MSQSHRRTLIKPPSRLNQPSRLNPNCPVWFEQKCQPPQLPPLSPQYQTFSSPNPRVPALNILNANNNNNNSNNHNYRHNCSHTLNTRNTHNPHNSHNTHSSHHYQHKHNNRNNNYLRNTNVSTSHQRRVRMLSQTDASSNTMPIIGSNNNNNYPHIPSQLSLPSASTNNNIHNTFMPNMYNAVNASTTNTMSTMSTMSNTTNNSNNSNNGIIPTPFSNTAASNNRINNIPIPIPMIPKPNNMINVSSFNKNNDNLQRLLPHIDNLSPAVTPATNKKTKTVNKMSRMDEKEQGKEKKAMDEVDELDEYKQSVKGWWIGQRIIVETQEGQKITGRIKDYFVATDKVQIWFDNDESTFEAIKLSDLLNWYVPDTYKISQYKNLKDLKYKIIDFIPKSNKFRPMDIDLLQRVQILYRDGKWYTAFIDGYDPVSRRHHVNYGDTAEWLWATKERIKPLNMRIMDHAEKIRTEIELNGNYAVSPPWDPIPYGLDENFQIHSSKLIKEKSKKSKKKSKRYKRKKMGTSSDEDYVVDNKKNRKMRKQKRKNSDLSISTESNQPNTKRQRITMNVPSAMGSNIINNTSTTIMVNNNYNHNNNAKKRKCKIKPKKIKPSIPSKPPPPKKKKKNKKYPRIANINGNIWKRTYSREEKKYFWCNNSSESSWNPWNDNKLNAPWMGETRQKWAKFKDEASKPYYYNYEDSKSTYKKPLDYKSDDQIDHDSAEDDDEYDD